MQTRVKTLLIVLYFIAITQINLPEPTPTFCSDLQDQALIWSLLKLDGRSWADEAEDEFLTVSCSLPAARGSLQPWSQGVIAVVVFLVLVAIAFVVNRFWCKDKV